MNKFGRRTLATALAFGMIAAACGGDDSGTSASSGDGGSADGTAGVLADICPANIVIQTDWFPEAEHGALYELVGEAPTIDSAKKTVRGPLVASGGIATGVDIEIRTGGPAIGGSQVVAQMKIDPDILLGYVATDEAIENYAEIPTKAIVAPLEINPQIIMWDPETKAGVRTIEDLKGSGTMIRYFESGAYMNYLVAAGIVTEEQLDGSYDGSSAVFVAEGGNVAQQGFASAEPFTYENLIPEWGKPVDFQLIHDAGWTTYAAPLAVLSENFEANKPCFEELVPIVQQAQVDYITNPAETNALIVEAVVKYEEFWLYSPELAEFSVKQQLELGLVGNGPDSTLGNFDNARLADFIQKALPVFAANNPPADLTPEDLVTNEFIDETIGL